MNKFFEELKRRNVIKAAISYGVLFWVLLQIGDIIFPLFGFGDQVLRVILIIALAGFIPWVVFAYVYELTPEGFQKTAKVKIEDSTWRSTGKKLNLYIIGGLALVVIVLLVDKFLIINESVQEFDEMEISLAVLPFENLSESEDAYFARGMTEDIFIQISNLTDFKILSSYKLKDYDTEGKSLKEIGEELGVSHVLLGNVRRSEEDIRIGCQLIATGKEEALWANSYNKKMASVFSLQKEIAVQIAKSLVRTFDPKDKQLADKKPTENLIAYDLYLRARDYTNEYEGESQRKAVELYKESISLDPYFTSAYTGLSGAYSLGYNRFRIFSLNYLDTAKMLAQKAIDLDPESPGAWNALGIVYAVQGKTEQSASMYMKSLEIDSMQPSVLNNIANYYGQKNALDKAIKLYKKAISLQSNYEKSKSKSIEYQNLGWAYLYLGFYDRALALGKRSLEIRENYFSANLLLTVSHYMLGDSQASTQSLQQAIREGEHHAFGLETVANFSYEYFDTDTGLFYLNKLEEHPDYDPKNNPYPNILKAHHFISQGKVFEANILLDEALSFYLDQMEKGIKFENYQRAIAVVYTLKGEEEKAVYWLEKLIDDGYSNYTELVLTNLLEGLHDNPGYIALMEKLKVKIDNMREQVLNDEASEQLRDLKL